MSTAVEIHVLGEPAPKGSNRAMVRGGRAVFVPGGTPVNKEKLKSWDTLVRQEALEVIGPRAEPVFVEVALAVAITFRLARPGGHWGKRGLRTSAPSWPAKKPDLDKLVRSTIDSLSGLVFDDDARIVRLVLAKEYAAPGREGAEIRVWEFKS